MVTLIPIEPLSEAHGMLIVDAFNRHFISWGGEEDGWGYCYGDCYGGNGWGFGYGDGYGGGFVPGDGSVPEEWRAE